MSRVAEAEAKSVMAISKQISRLEENLNQALFIRTRRSLVLTQFGSELKTKAEKLLEQHDAFEHWARAKESTVTGELRVVCQSNEIINETLIPWLAEFTEQYPSLNITLDVREQVIDILKDDFDIFWAVGSYLGDRYSGLKRKPLWKSVYGLFASPSYLQTMGYPKKIEDLEAHKVVGYLHNQPSNVLITSDGSGEPKYIMPQCRIKTVTGMLQLAEAGLGIINAPADTKAVKELIQNNRLEPVLQDYWWEDAEVYVYYHPSRPVQPKIRAFLDFFVKKRNQWSF